MSFVPVNPRPFLQDLVNKDVIVRLKWGETEYKGRLVVRLLPLPRPFFLSFRPFLPPTFDPAPVSSSDETEINETGLNLELLTQGLLLPRASTAT
jgi:hypothetical protein